jgi:benzylsuccinate CoA-transferase BbsF subunit
LTRRSKEKMKRKLLEGIRVVDFTWALSGPISTKHLSDLGAEVIKIETSVRLDIQRTQSKWGSFNQHNSGKLAITVNLKKPKGLELVRQLIAKSDVVVDNFAGGSMDKMGLGYEVLKQLKPDIIMLSSCMQGATGPFARHPGIGFRLTALSGFNQITGWPDRQPGWIGAYTDFIAPRYNILALMAALEYRHRTGKGQFIDMSQFEAGVHFMGPLVLDWAVNQNQATRMGNESPSAAPHNAYRCLGEDRWCAISVFTDAEWEGFCGVIGSPQLATDPRFSSLPARKKNEQELDNIVNHWTGTRSAEDVMNAMQAAGVPAGVLQTGEDFMDHDPQVQARHFFVELEHPEVGKYRTNSGAHFLLSKCETDLVRAPLMGEHNEYVFKKLLGVSDAEYDSLVKDGTLV